MRTVHYDISNITCSIAQKVRFNSVHIVSIQSEFPIFLILFGEIDCHLPDEVFRIQ